MQKQKNPGKIICVVLPGFFVSFDMQSYFLTVSKEQTKDAQLRFILLYTWRIVFRFP